MTNALKNGIDKHWRLANYISICQMYLKSNFLLKNKLSKDDLKDRCVGHWGVSPALNFVYAHVDSFSKRNNITPLIVVGTGHAGSALVSNLYIDGVISKFYPKYSYDYEGLKKLVSEFGKEGGFRTEINPEYPLTIYDGGELGYALSVAYGTILDNPQALTFCFIGDGEAETGTTSASWLINKFINKKFSGRVIPILNLNGKKMGSKSLFSTMSDKQLTNYFSSMGYNPVIVYGKHDEMYNALENVHKYKNEDYLIILKTPKGWTAVDTENVKIENELRAHKNPLSDLNEDEQVEYIEKWLESYNVNELYSEEKGISKEILDIVPENICNNMFEKQTLNLPDVKNFEVKSQSCKNVAALSEYIAKIIETNENFRIFSPDELVSNGFSKLFEVTKNNLTEMSNEKDGKVIEILNENICQGLMQGYIQTGRNALFIGYEAFMPVITSMMSQLMKYIYQARKRKWRKDIGSFTYILTSVCWENNYSHQNPEFLNSILNKDYDFVNVYTPLDSNNALITLEKCLKSKNCINVIVVSKKINNQFENIDMAKNNIYNGFNIIKDSENEDLTFVVSGDSVCKEVIEADKMLKDILPKIQTKIIYVSDLNKLKRNKNSEIEKLFENDVPYIYAFHGYESLMRNILFEKNNFTIVGYKDRSDVAGSSFRKMYLNGISRYNILGLALKKLYEYRKIEYDKYIKFINLREEECHE